METRKRSMRSSQSSSKSESESRTISFTPSSEEQRQFILSEAYLNLIMSPRGEGKSFLPETPCLQYDGRIVRHDEVRIGDLVMGVDGTRRLVCDVTSGMDDMFVIEPMKGDPFTVTAEHVLTLYSQYTKSLVDINLQEVRKKSRGWFGQHQLVHVPVDFPFIPVVLEPYFLGIWLADGESRAPAICTPDPEIVEYLEKFATWHDIDLRKSDDQRSKASDYHLTTGNVGGRGKNPVTNLLRHYGLLGNKHIPHVYKVNSYEVRMQLLAGLLDGDGWVNRSGYQITQKRKSIADDIAFIARSLGFQAKVNEVTGRIASRNFEGVYYRVYINGDCSQIPLKIARKCVVPRRQIKNVLHDGIRRIEYVGRKDYCGLVVDGDHHYLLGDFTITHNTVAGFFGSIHHANRHDKSEWPIRWALVRDTRRQIGISTARTIIEWVPPPYSIYKGKDNEPEAITILIGNQPAIIFDCFGVNTPDDLNRFQSYEAGGVWIEEPAAAATNSEFSVTGVSETVLAVAITSLRKSRIPRIQISMNPPPADHWTAQLWHIPGYEDAQDIEEDMSIVQREARERIRERSRIFQIPAGANKALDEKSPGYRENMHIFLLGAGRQDLVARLVEGRVGYAKIGEAVTPGFSQKHIAEGLKVIGGRPFYIGYDFGLMPAAVIGQIVPSGHLFIHAAFAMENVGIEQLITRQMLPWLQQYPEVRNYIHVVGHEAGEREQSNSEESALKTIVKFLGGTYLRGPVSWSGRRQACHEALEKTIGHIPWMRVNKTEASKLIRCLDGGWHYPTAGMTGTVSRDIPEKRGTMPSLGDGFAHLVSVLLRRPGRGSDWDEERRKTKPRVVLPMIRSGSRGRTGA